MMPPPVPCYLLYAVYSTVTNVRDGNEFDGGNLMFFTCSGDAGNFAEILNASSNNTAYPNAHKFLMEHTKVGYSYLWDQRKVYLDVDDILELGKDNIHTWNTAVSWLKKYFP